MAKLRAVELTKRIGDISETIRLEVEGVDLVDEAHGSWFGHWFGHFLIMIGWH